MHDQLFANVDEWTTGETESAIREVAGQTGLDLEEYDICVNSRRPWEHILGDLYDSQGEVNQTPSFIFLCTTVRDNG